MRASAALESAEVALFPAIAKGACLRFVASRTEDWLETPDDAMVTPQGSDAIRGTLAVLRRSRRGTACLMCPRAFRA